jgi:CheY-like chemotaxis protein
MTHPICIIDDDDDVREVMTFALEYEGMAAIKFNRASLALEALSGMKQDEYPCLIFVDYLMPQMDGLEFISKLKEKYPKTLGKIPVVLSSAGLFDESESLPHEVLRVPKPIDLYAFIELARKYYYSSENSASLS